MTFKPPCYNCGKPVKLTVSVMNGVVWYEKVKCYRCGAWEAARSFPQTKIRMIWKPKE